MISVDAQHNRISREPFLKMDTSQRCDYFLQHGFVVIPGSIETSKVADIHREIDELKVPNRSGPFDAPSFAEQIGNPIVIELIRVLYGPDIRFFKGLYLSRPTIAESSDGVNRQPLHQDWGKFDYEGDYRNTSPAWVNVALYLDTLSQQSGPLWVVPGTHRRFDLAPGEDLESLASHACMVLPQSGDAVLFHCYTVHGGGTNRSDGPRRALFYSYRPAWARPMAPVPPWPEEAVRDAPPNVRPLLEGLSDGLPAWN